MAGEPRTIDAGIPGPQQSQSFTLPPTVTIDLEAVYIEVDTSGAGGPVTAELTISEQSGVVIARKSQVETIPAGVQGSATWALRLDDDGGGAGGSGIEFDVMNVGDWLDVHATGSEPGPLPSPGIRLHADTVLELDGDELVRVVSGIIRTLSQSVELTAASNVDIQGQQLNIGGSPSGPNPFAYLFLNGLALSFFGVTPVVQQPTPATLGDVIALLQAYGLTP